MKLDCTWHLSRQKILPLYTRMPSHTASPPCTDESNTDTWGEHSTIQMDDTNIWKHHRQLLAVGKELQQGRCHDVLP